MSPATRAPAVAGSFYDRDPRRLTRTVDALLDDAIGEGVGPPATEAPAGLVAPHAGYVYSGPVAATVYAHLRPHAASVSRVVLLGPSHFVPLAGVAVPAAAGFATPLGTVPVDVPGCLELVATFPETVTIDDGAHEDEHALEVQLPFLQRVLTEGFSVLPLVVGGAPAEAVADVLDALDLPGAAGASGAAVTMVVVSTDLSHYLDQRAAAARDRATAQAVVERAPDRIGSRDACGAAPLRGLLTWALRHDLSVSLLDLRTSADTAGDPRRVVGYGAFRVDRPVG